MLQQIWKASSTLGPAYNKQIDAKKTVRCRRMFVETELFNIVVNDFDAKNSTRRQVLGKTEAGAGPCVSWPIVL